jgi:hypothetical protein
MLLIVAVMVLSWMVQLLSYCQQWQAGARSMTNMSYGSLDHDLYGGVVESDIMTGLL